MGVRSRWRDLARPAALAAAAAVLAAALAGSLPARALAGWSAPAPIAPSAALDILPAQIGFAPTGGAALSFGVQDEDDPANSIADVVERSAAGGLSPARVVPSAQAVLGLAFDGPTLELLTGTSPVGDACCSAAQVVPLGRGGAFHRSTTLVGDLTGAALGRLVTLRGGSLLAAIASEAGVWAAQSRRSGHFARARELTAPGDRPQSLAASALPGGAGIVAWTATSSGDPEAGPRQVFAAIGSLLSGPRRRSTIVTVPAGHEVQELALASGPGVPTVAWIESWFDRHGGYHAEPVAVDLSRRRQTHPFPDGAEVADGLSIAGDPRGDQVIAWQECTSAGSCSVRAALRAAGSRYGAPVRLGAIDATEAPVATISTSGEALVGWIAGGQVHVAEHRGSGSRFGAARIFPDGGLASDLALSFGPGREAIAAWTQGIAAPQVVEALYRAPG